MKPLFTKYLWVVQTSLCLLGLLLIVFSTLTSIAPPGSTRSSALFNIGITVLATALFTIFQSATGTDAASTIQNTLEFQRSIYDIGLERVHLGIGDESIFDRFETARSIDMLYNTAKNCSYRYGTRMETAITTRGCKVRILIADPNNKALLDVGISGGLCPGTAIENELKDVIGHFELLTQRLKNVAPRLTAGSLELRTYSCVPTNSIVIVDGKIVRHTPYLPYLHSSEVPIYDVTRERGGRLFEVYMRVFNDVWIRSKSILKVDFDAEAQLSAANILNLNFPH